jgi:hypothetical protein
MAAASDSAPGTRPIAKSAQARIRKVHYDPESTLFEARRLYFEANGFPLDGGYEAKWVDFELGPIPMPFPNSDARRRAVRIHDLHHVLTGYQTDIHGEAEISAWELAAGCGDMLAAWGLNLGGMALGMMISPRRTWRAWVRGRQSGMLYRTRVDDQLLNRKLGEMRSELGVDKPPGHASVGDVLLFFAYWQVGAWTSLLSLPLMLPFLIGFAAFGAAKKLAAKPA